MTLRELKDSIKNNTLSDEFLILKCEDNDFVAKQYLEAICKNKGLVINTITSVLEPQVSALSAVFNFDNYLNILVTETFTEVIEDYSACKNTIVICYKVDKAVLPRVSNYLVEIPKLTDWQLQEYIKIYCSGLDSVDCEKLTAECKYNIYKIENVVNNISLFEKNEQKLIFSELQFTQDTDLIEVPVFDLVDALIKKDIRKLGYCLFYRKNCDFEPTGIITQLLKKYKYMALLKWQNISAEQLGISRGQAYYINKDAALYTQEEIAKKLGFVADFDRKLKLGLIDINKNDQVDYIISNIIGL